MEITGKEMKSESINIMVEVTHFLKVKCSMKSELTERIWSKRKCFMCGSKFKDGDSPIACITKKGLNKIICEKCYSRVTKEQKDD